MAGIVSNTCSMENTRSEPVKKIGAALAALLLAVAALTGCGDDDDTTAGQPASENGHGGGGHSCEPSGTALTVTAKNVKYDKDCLAAPAGQPFTIAFDNNDAGVPHNVAIFRNPEMSDRLFTGETFNGDKTVTYDVPALPAGDYHFHCDAHPDLMEGTFVVA